MDCQVIVVLLIVMKTTQSFFPTRTHFKSGIEEKERVVQLMKPKSRPVSSPKEGRDKLNIFRDSSDPPYRQAKDNPSLRPVGGDTMFKRMIQSKKDHSNQLKKMSKKSYKDNTLRSIAIASASRFRRQRNDDEGDMLPLKSINENKMSRKQPVAMVDEMFQQHADYQPSYSSSKLRHNTVAGDSKSMMKTETKGRPDTEAKGRPKTQKTSKSGSREEWVSAQSKEYHDKTALLNEINYNRPLVERYGNHYFEHILRNRFQEELKPPPFVYLLTDNQFADSKAISKIKKNRPDIRERQMLVLRGKKMSANIEDM